MKRPTNTALMLELEDATPAATVASQASGGEEVADFFAVEDGGNGATAAGDVTSQADFDDFFDALPASANGPYRGHGPCR